MTRIGRLALAASLALAGLAGQAGASEQVKLDELPAPVRSTFERESKGGQLMRVERDQEHGKTYYEGQIKKGEREVELKVAPDGKVLSRE